VNLRSLPTGALALTLVTQPGCRVGGSIFRAGLFTGVIVFLFSLAIIGGVVHLVARHH
jgi:hypothetical protein